MESKATAHEDFTEAHYRVLAMLQRSAKGTRAFTDEQIEELKVGPIVVNYLHNDYTLISAMNQLRGVKAGDGFKIGTEMISRMVWDLLESGELDDDPSLRSAAEDLHRRSGSEVRKIRVSNPVFFWIAKNKDILRGAVVFLDTPERLLEIGASSKKLISIRYSCCGEETSIRCDRFNEKVKSHRKYGTPVKCADCAKSFIPVRIYFGRHAQILDDSGVRLDRVTEEQFELPSGSSEEIEVFFGCHGGYVLISPESLKSKIQRARNMNHSQIACNDCSVTQGKIESKAIAFLEGCAAHAAFLNLPSAQIVKQFRIPEIENMPFDALVISADGARTILEIDGGFHYENRDESALAKKIEADRVKTEHALRGGYNLIRIDERNLVRLSVEIQKMLLRATVGDVERYTVMGEECPGAALVPAELKR